MKMCPYCEQDAVWHVGLHTSANFTFSMCFECDSVWPQGEEVSDETGTNFEAFMSSISQPVDWSKVERISMIE
jgi:Zn-finger nucleic acid-binding protein